MSSFPDHSYPSLTKVDDAVRRSDSSGPSVLYVIPGNEQGANMIFARRQFAALRDRGMRVHAFYLQSRTSPGSVWRDRQRFRREVKSLRPDIIHAQFGTMTAFFVVLSSWLPLVITYRGSDLNPVPSIGRLRRWFGFLFSQLSALRAQKVVCVSEELVDRLWWRKSIATVIPSGIDTARFLPQDRARARTQLGWSQTEKVVLFNASRLPRVKRLDLAQASFSLLQESVAGVRLHLLDGSTPPERLPVLMNAADCLLVTSDYEGSPNIVKEALACNLPVVSVDVGDVRTRLQGVSPSVIAERNPAALASAMAEILADCSRSNGASRIVSLSLDSTSEALERLYRSLAVRQPIGSANSND